MGELLSPTSPQLLHDCGWTYSACLLDSHEFATNEVINVVQSVNLETLSTEAGNKDFIAVATSIHRGEDLAVRGAVSAFSWQGDTPRVWHEC
jgi:CPSF A subunit region